MWGGCNLPWFCAMSHKPNWSRHCTIQQLKYCVFFPFKHRRSLSSFCSFSRSSWHRQIIINCIGRTGNRIEWAQDLPVFVFGRSDELFTAGRFWYPRLLSMADCNRGASFSSQEGSFRPTARRRLIDWDLRHRAVKICWSVECPAVSGTKPVPFNRQRGCIGRGCATLYGCPGRAHGSTAENHDVQDRPRDSGR